MGRANVDALSDEELDLGGINRVWCLFEQSGTFAGEFRKRGKVAFDVDIEDRFGKTDIQEDLFSALCCSDIPADSVLNEIRRDDFIMAFFPCTYFTDQSQLISRGDGSTMKSWSVLKKIKRSEEEMWKRAKYYQLFCNLFEFSLDVGCKMVVENPYGRCNFLRQYFPIRPAVVIPDRRVFGDAYKKPTQFFFLNCRPASKLSQTVATDIKKNLIEDSFGFSRSIISPLFAKMFVRNYFW